jgi:hypothetical protein
MTRLRRTAHILLAIGVAAAGLFTSETVWRFEGGPLASEAGAVIGAPRTPVSYAGVARRTARRTTVATGAAVGAAAATAGAAAAASRCVQKVNAYGVIQVQCP